MTSEASGAGSGSAGGRVGPERRGGRFTLRPAMPDDAATLAAVDAATSTQSWSEETFCTDVLRDDRRYVVAVDREDGEVVGYAGIALLAGDAHVTGIAVAPSAQRRGLGRALLDAVCVEAAHADAAAMTLEVRPSNAPARHLYRLVGFEESGRRPRYYPDGEDALILWRPGERADAREHLPDPGQPPTRTTDGSS